MTKAIEQILSASSSPVVSVSITTRTTGPFARSVRDGSFLHLPHLREHLVVVLEGTETLLEPPSQDKRDDLFFLQGRQFFCPPEIGKRNVFVFNFRLFLIDDGDNLGVFPLAHRPQVFVRERKPGEIDRFESEEFFERRDLCVDSQTQVTLFELFEVFFPLQLVAGDLGGQIFQTVERSTHDFPFLRCTVFGNFNQH